MYCTHVQASVGFSSGYRFCCSIKKLFGPMTNYSPKEVEALEEVQSELNMPELHVVKPSDTRWLSHESCMW